MKKYRTMVVSYGYADIEAETENEALEKCKEMASLGRHAFDWSDPDDAQIVDEILDY